MRSTTTPKTMRSVMHWNRTALIALPLAFSGLVACGEAQPPPKSLLDAREQFVRAKDGLAMQLDPTDVHEADVALQRAEQAWQHSPDDPRTTDLAIIADRKALIAQSQAAAIKAEQDTRDATAQLEAMRATQLQSAQGQLSQTRQVLGATQMQLQQQQEVSAVQQQKMQGLE